jgi:hypothetical protein
MSTMPEHKPIARCSVCGATELSGRLDTYKQVLQCMPCIESIIELEEEEGWYQDPVTLKWHNPAPEAPYVTAARAAVDQLHAALKTGGFPDVEIVHPLAGVRVPAVHGYRLHLYVPGQGRAEFAGRFFSPELEHMLDPAAAREFPIQGATLADIAHRVRNPLDHPVWRKQIDTDRTMRDAVAALEPEAFK